MSDLLKKASDYAETLKADDCHLSKKEVENYAKTYFQAGYLCCQKEYEEKLRWISPNVKPKLIDGNSMFSVNVSIRVESGEYEYSGYYNFHTQKWLIYPKEEPFEFQLIAGWRYFL